VFSLIQSAEVKQLSKATGEWGSQFDYLIDQIIIPAVTQSFATYCHRPDWDKAARVEYLSPRPGARRLFLSSPPVAAAQVGPPIIEALRLYRDISLPRAYGADTELVNGTDFFVFEEEGVIERVGCTGWSWVGWGWPKTIKVTYTGGYLTDNAVGCPADLKLAAITQAKILFDRRDQMGITGQSLEGGSISLLTPLNLPKAVTITLDNYRVFGNG